MLAGFGLGAVAVQGLHAQAKPTVYYISEIDVTNPEAYAKRERPSEEDEEGAEGEAAESGQQPDSSED